MSINIYIYLEYRKYLQDYYNFMKERDKSFTFRSFSKKAGVHAPNFLQLLIQKKRNLKKSTILQVSRAIGHTAAEAEYFNYMVHLDQAKTNDEKVLFFNKLGQIRKPYAMDVLTEIQFEHYKCWYYKAIRELLGLYPFYPEEKYAYRHLASLLLPQITESEARTAVKHLLKLGLLKQQTDTRIVQTSRFITTGDEVQSLFVRQFHETMIELAKKSQDRIPPDLRDISSVTASISKSGFETIKSEIQLFRKRILEIVKSDSDPEGVYQINFQLFPITKINRK